MITRDPIFVHSSFRTSSTWLWEKFRAQPSVRAYCEPFNEFLGEATIETIGDRRADNWASGHPVGAPYFSEFEPFLVEGAVGVQDFHPEFPFHRYIPEGGVLGSVSPDEVRYIRLLVDYALQRDQLPVIACTRSLGRLAGLKEAFGGLHILLYRALFDQWISYAYQRDNGGEYFTQTLGRIIRFNAPRVPLFQWLLEEFWVGEAAEGNWNGFADQTAAFKTFVGVHLYLYAYVSRVADLAIDSTRLACDGAYQLTVSRVISERTGIRLNLRDARRAVHYAEICWDGRVVDDLRAKVTEFLTAEQAPYDEKIVAKLANGLKADTYLAQSFGNEAVAIGTRPLTMEMERIRAQLASTEATLASEKAISALATARASELARSLEQEIKKRNDQVSALVSSTSWRITKPVRYIGRILRKLPK